MLNEVLEVTKTLETKNEALVLGVKEKVETRKHTYIKIKNTIINLII